MKAFLKLFQSSKSLLILLVFLSFGFAISCSSSEETSDGASPTSSENIVAVTDNNSDNNSVNVGTTTPTANCLEGGIYIDSIAGKDTNTGMSSCSAWKSLSQISPASLSANTKIFLKKESTFYGFLQIDKNGVTVDSYGEGALPLIDGSITVSGWNSLGGGIYSQMISTNALNHEGLGNITEGGSFLTLREWNTDYSTTLSGQANGSYTYDFGNSTMYIKTAKTPSTQNYRASFQMYGVKAEDGVNNIIVNNVAFTRFSLMAIEFKNCNGCQARNVSIKDGGGAVVVVENGGASYLYAGNGIEFDHASTNGVVDTATISNIFDSCISPQTYASNKTAANFLFTNLSLSRCGFAGIEIAVLSNGGTTGSSISNVTISKSIMTDMGRGWSGQRYGTEGYGIKIAADSTANAGSISNTIIQNVTISNSINSGIRMVGDTGVTDISKSKIFANAEFGIEVAEPTATAPKLLLNTSLIYNNGNYGVKYTCNNCQGFKLYHNTFYNNTTINLGVLAQANQAIIKNNLFFSSASMTHLYSSGTLVGAGVNYNCYQDTTNMFGYNNVAYSTVSAFNGATNFEVNGIGNGTVGLSNAGGGDFTLTAGSSCNSMGVTGTGILSDYSGVSYANPPSAGAYQ